MPTSSSDTLADYMNRLFANGENTTTTYDEISNVQLVYAPLSSFTTTSTASPYYEISFDDITPYANIPIRVDIGGNGKIGVYTFDPTDSEEEKMEPPTELILYLTKQAEETEELHED